MVWNWKCKVLAVGLNVIGILKEGKEGVWSVVPSINVQCTFLATSSIPLRVWPLELSCSPR